MNEQLPHVIYCIVTDSEFRQKVLQNPQAALAPFKLAAADSDAIIHTLTLPSADTLINSSVRFGDSLGCSPDGPCGWMWGM